MKRTLARWTVLGALLTASGVLAQGAPTGSSQGPTGSSPAPTGDSQAPSSYGEPVRTPTGDSQAPSVYSEPVPPPTPPPPPPSPGLVRRYAVGPRFAIIPGVFIPSNGSAGFSLGLEGGYGFDFGPVILTPTVALQGNWGGDFTVYSVLGGGRLTVPLGSFGPFVEFGIGYGHVSGPFDYSKGGVALRGGAGFIYFFSPNFAIGIAVRYDAIADTPFKGWTFAPLILLAF